MFFENLHLLVRIIYLYIFGFWRLFWFSFFYIKPMNAGLLYSNQWMTRSFVAPIYTVVPNKFSMITITTACFGNFFLRFRVPPYTGPSVTRTAVMVKIWKFNRWIILFFGTGICWNPIYGWKTTELKSLTKRINR